MGKARSSRKEAKKKYEICFEHKILVLFKKFCKRNFENKVLKMNIFRKSFETKYAFNKKLKIKLEIFKNLKRKLRNSYTDKVLKSKF